MVSTWMGDHLATPCAVSMLLGGHTVAQLVDALPYKLEGHGFDSQ